MKTIIIAATVVLTVLGALIFRGITGSSNSNEQKTLASNITIIDVRTEEEFNTSHVTNAQLFPVETMQAGEMPNLSKDTPIALYCRSGRRAGEALVLMKQAGFTNVTNLGGLSDVPNFGLALTE